MNLMKNLLNRHFHLAVVSFSLILSVFMAQADTSHADEEFPWELFLPAITPRHAPNIALCAGISQVAIRWKAVSGATSYNIYWSTTPGVTVENGTKIPDIAENSYRHTKLANGTTYYYIVTANQAVGESKPSAEASVRPTEMTKISVYNAASVMTGYATYKYNLAGKMTETCGYVSGLLASSVKNEYNGDGRLVVKSSIYIGPTNELQSYTVYDYNAGEKVSRSSTYNALMDPPELSSYTTYLYNDQGKETEASTFNGYTDQLTTRITKDYTKDGKLVTKSSNYLGPAELMLLQEYTTYEYNEKGRVTKASRVNAIPDPDELISVTTNEYNEDGKITRSCIENALTGEETGCTVHEYNAQGDLVKTSKYNFNEQLTSYTTIENNEAGAPTKLTNYGPTGLMSTYSTVEYGS